MPITLDDEARKALNEALLRAFNKDSFRLMVRLELGMRLEDEVDVARGLKFVVDDFVGVSEQDEFTEKLVRGALRASTNMRLATVAQQLGVEKPKKLEDYPPSLRAPGRSLEEVVNAHSVIIDLDEFKRSLDALGPRVCRIERRDLNPLGTGFLVGADLVLTNYHVMEKVFGGERDPADIVFRFFNHAGSGSAGSSLAEATCDLAPDYRVDASPYADGDKFVDGAEAEPDQLDYALVRLARPVGNEPIADGAAKRGWITAASSPPPVEKDDFLVVVQHPQGGAQAIAVGLVLGFNKKSTRMRHDASTRCGSSGSPCLTMDLRLCALHHGTEPITFTDGRPVAERATFNKAIPLRQIIRQMKDRNITSFWDKTST